MLVWSLDKENPRLGISKEEEGNRKEGRELLNFLARFQKQIFAEPGIVRPASGQAQEETRNISVTDLAPHTVTQEKLARKQGPGRVERNITMIGCGLCLPAEALPGLKLQSYSLTD